MVRSLLVAALVGSVACGNGRGADCVTGAAALVASDVRPSLDVAPAMTDSTWRSRVLAELAARPDSSRWRGTMFFAGSVTDDDTLFVARHNGEVTYLFRGMSAAGVQMTIADLRASIQDTYPRLTFVAIGANDPGHQFITCPR